MILDNRRLTPTELILLHIQLETEDVRDDDTLRLVSMVAAAAVQAQRAEAAPSAAGSHAHHDEGQMGLLAGSVLARVMWDQRGMET